MRKLMLAMLVLMVSVVMVACGEDADKDKNAVPGNEVENNDGVNNEDGKNNEEAANNDALNNEDNADAGENATGDSGFEDLILYLDQMGLEPGEPFEQDPAVAASLGAEKGIILPIAEIDIQLFIYDENGESFNQEQFDEATSEGTVTFDAAGEEFSIPMLMNKNLGLALYEDHYKKDELVEAFENF